MIDSLIKKEIEPLLVLDDVLYCKDCGSRNVKKSYKPYKIGENIMKILDKYNNQQEYKWKCDICGTGFNNFQAQGFDNKIYCPLCYFKHEFNQYKSAWEELKNISQNDDGNEKTAHDFLWFLEQTIQELEQKHNLGKE